MEEAREFKHVCKFCSKSFPCGRSLGGHMRSHMITITESTEQLARKKLPSVSDTETNGYGLRENPKKSKRNADHSSAITSQQNGKSFVSENKRVSNQDSGASANQKLVTNSQSETETVTPNRKRRSKRRTIRYIASAAAATSNSCSFSVANNNNNNGYEQEELAMCLMMLSRDVGSRGVLNSVAESSDNNSVFLEPENEVKKLNSSEHNSISKKKIRDSYDLELRSDSLRRSTTTDVSDAEFYKDSQMRSKFECATCNKIFHSYQALGGHRASHKKIKACFGSKIDSSDNSIEAEHSLDRTANSKLIKFINNENSSDHYFAADCDVRNRVDTSYGANKSHECPICLRVFPSGQALGGHKRSHLVGGKEARNNPTIVIENPIPEIRNFLDLNLPAPDEEDSNARLGLQQWWIRRSHKHEALVGLISN